MICDEKSLVGSVDASQSETQLAWPRIAPSLRHPRFRQRRQRVQCVASHFRLHSASTVVETNSYPVSLAAHEVRSPRLPFSSHFSCTALTDTKSQSAQ